MNGPTENGLQDLYKKYVYCVDKIMADFVNSRPLEVKTQEWCPEEKKAYFEYMRMNFRTQYDNIIRLESQNY